MWGPQLREPDIVDVGVHLDSPNKLRIELTGIVQDSRAEGGYIYVKEGARAPAAVAAIDPSETNRVVNVYLGYPGVPLEAYMVSVDKKGRASPKRELVTMSMSASMIADIARSVSARTSSSSPYTGSSSTPHPGPISSAVRSHPIIKFIHDRVDDDRGSAAVLLAEVEKTIGESEYLNQITARIMRECRAKEKMIGAAVDVARTDVDVLVKLLAPIARVWDDHPDYKVAWVGVR